MPKLDDNREAFEELISEHMAGLPITIVMPRLMLLIFSLLEEIDSHGNDTYKILRAILERLET